MDCKEIFIKTMDFVRNYDPGSEEYTRRIRLNVHDSVNEVARFKRRARRKPINRLINADELWSWAI